MAIPTLCTQRCIGAASDCVAGEVCCDDSAGAVCQAASAACAGEVIACDGTEDCPGQLCCSNTTGTECAAACTGYHICHDASECAAGEGCCPNGGGVPLGALTHCLALAPGESCPLPP